MCWDRLFWDASQGAGLSVSYKNISHKEKAVQNFKRFHGRAPEKRTAIRFTMPKRLTFLGGGIAIEYESDKILHGQRKPRLYRHKFGSGVKIYLHPNRQWLLVGGGNFRVTDWMRG